MKNAFETEEGKQVLSYLREKLGVTIVSTNQHLAHLKVGYKDSFIVSTIKAITEAERKYPRVFTEGTFLLFEYPLEANTTKFALYSLSWELRTELIKEFGGRSLIDSFWAIDNTAGSPFGYIGDKLPEASEIIKYVESLMHE